MAVPGDAVVTRSAAHLRPLALALAASASLHLALIAGIGIKPQSTAAPQTVIEARLAQRHAAAEPASAPKPQAIAEIQTPAEQEQPAKAAPEKPAQEGQAGPPPDAAVPGQSSPLPALEIPLAEDPTYYPGKVVDVHPTALQPIVPVYPDAVSDAGVEGGVTVLLFIDEFGKVRDLSVVEAAPPGYFEESALSAFRNAHFTPAIKDGRAVKSRVLIRVSYDLNRPELKKRLLKLPAE
jgi:protein TonB